MPDRAPRRCSSSCPHLQPCPVHGRRAWHGRPSARGRGYDAEYERNRAIVMREEDRCALCGGPGLDNDEADHKIPLAQGGTNERSNLQRAHRRCNAVKNAGRGAA